MSSTVTKILEAPDGICACRDASDYNLSKKIKKSAPLHGAWGERWFISYSSSVLDMGEWSARRQGRALSPGKDSSSHWTGGSVCPRAGRGSSPGLSVSR